MKELKAMKSVYTYHFPEVSPLLHQVEDALPDRMYRVTAPAAEIEEAILKKNLFSPHLFIPSTKQGYVDLDEFHVPVIKRIVSAYYSIVPSLGGFKYVYPTSGSSEGIFHILAKLRTKGAQAINVFDGEYEGFGAYAGHLGMEVNSHDFETFDPWKTERGTWFISNPSARDGNIIGNSVIEDICNAGNEVILDLAYVGATRPYVFDASGVSALVMSFSKPYGVFRQRTVGFAFSREPIDSLYGNKWFKDILRLFQSLKLVEELGPAKTGTTALYHKYRPVQEGIVDKINQESGLGMLASDSLLLSHLREEDLKLLGEEQLGLIQNFRRGRGYRFCLTPYFEEQEG